jgi:hypothetical protein
MRVSKKQQKQKKDTYMAETQRELRTGSTGVALGKELQVAVVYITATLLHELEVRGVMGYVL